MKSLLPVVFFLLIGTVVNAQQNYFVYVQTENKQPFTVKVNDRTLTSSATGYMMISKLTAGNYTLNISFAKDEFPPQSLALNVVNDDAGYLLKNYGTKGWGLYNLRTAEISMANGVKEKAEGDDMFTATLGGVANTNLTPAKPKEAVIPVSNPVVKEEKKEPVAEPKHEAVAAVNIKKAGGTKDADGISMIYIDENASGKDTINIFIPAVIVREAKEPAAEPVAVKNVAVKEDVPATTKAETKTTAAKDAKFLDIELQNPNTKSTDSVFTGITEIVPVQKPQVTTAVPKDKPLVSFNSDCKMNARDDEFLKLRKKMAGEKEDEAMVADAQKMFKQMCWSVEQIKSLSVLFATDAGKYLFFDAAYPHVYDTQNFPSLQSQLTDSYYINRFKAMVRN